jgi:hypothetical protein
MTSTRAPKADPSQELRPHIAKVMTGKCPDEFAEEMPIRARASRLSRLWLPLKTAYPWIEFHYAFLRLSYKVRPFEWAGWARKSMRSDKCVRIPSLRAQNQFIVL